MIEDTISQVAKFQATSGAEIWKWNISVLVLGLVFTVGFGLWYFKGARSHQKLNAIPTIWTSLGILGTFCAIVKTLSGGIEKICTTDGLSDTAAKAVEDFGEEVVAEANGLSFVVVRLVDGIIPAFWTSIIGISGAILTTIAIKIIYAYEEEGEKEDLEKLQEALEKSLSKSIEKHLCQLRMLYDKVYETNKSQAKILIDEYLQGIRIMLSDSQASMTDQTQNLFKNHTLTISGCFAQELQVLNNLAEEGKQVIKTIPDSIENAKADAVKAVEQALVDKYHKLLEGNSAFVDQLLVKVKQLESALSQNALSSYESTIGELKKQMETLLSSINRALSSSANLLNQTSKTLSTDLNEVTISLENSSNEYASLVSELNRMLPIIEIQTNQAEESTKAVTRTNEQLKELVRSVEEIIGKNQQLRFELMQWKRVHKQVKINDKTNMKECPNCHEENPIEANFCKKCTYPFWEIQTIGSKLNGDKQ